MDKFKIAVEIIEHDDGAISVRELHPDRPINEFYGRFLGWGQAIKLGLMLFGGVEVPAFAEIDRTKEYKIDPKEVVAEVRMRRQWEHRRDKLAPLVFERDGYFCKSCETPYNLTIDHIMPIARGGTNDLENLQPLCKSCNSRKGAR